MANYLEILKKSAEASGNIVCVGLDPIFECFSKGYGVESKASVVKNHITAILSEMSRLKISPAAFKPNIGYYSSLDAPDYRQNGSFDVTSSLKDIIYNLKSNFNYVPVILDSKRGDISRSSLNYAIEAYDVFKADAVTVSPYMGTDSVMPFTKESKGVYVLCRTSNPGAAVIQNLKMANGEELYMHIAHQIVEWSNEFKGIGAVVGATNLREFENIAKLFAKHNIPMLIPGVGSQGGSASDVISIMKKVGYPLYLARINSSSNLTHPWKKGPAPYDWLEQCVANIKKLISEASL